MANLSETGRLLQGRWAGASLSERAKLLRRLEEGCSPKEMEVAMAEMPHWQQAYKLLHPEWQAPIPEPGTVGWDCMPQMECWLMWGVYKRYLAGDQTLVAEIADNAENRKKRRT